MSFQAHLQYKPGWIVSMYHKEYASSRFNTIDYCLGGLALVVILILYFFVLIKFSSKKTLQIPESFFDEISTGTHSDTSC